MKLSLRNKYFGWLIVLMLAIYLVLAAVLTGIELHEAWSEGTRLSEDIGEVVAFLFVMLFTLPVTMYLAWYIAGRLLRPLEDVEATAALIRQGRLDERISLPDDQQLARLAATINEAFDRYATAVRRLEKFSADASHQLRTPIAAIRTSAEVTMQQTRSATDYEESLSDILEQTGRLNQTVDQLLLLARMDDSVRGDFSPLMMSNLIASWVEEARQMFESHAIHCMIETGCAEWTLSGNAVLLRQCFDNLINNAVAITAEAGTIHVRLHRSSGGVQWIVEDSGPGIPFSERELVFDRFYRGRTTTVSGSGLGLAIVKEIVHLHGGKIHAAESAALSGAAMVMEFPA